VNYAKSTLAIVAGLLLGLFGPSLAVLFRGIAADKATGFAVVSSGFSEALLPGRLWILGLLFAALLWAASRLSNKLLRFFLFWTPTTLILAFSFFWWPCLCACVFDPVKKI